MPLIYGKYVSRVRHSTLRRPFARYAVRAPPSALYEFTEYLVHIVPPSTIVAEPHYCIQLSRIRSVDGAVTGVCTKLVRPSTFYVPPDWCYTYYGGYICDYIATLIATSVFLPAELFETSTIELEVRGLPTYAIGTAYDILLRRLPTVLSSPEYLVLLSAPSAVAYEVGHDVLIALPHIAFEITGQDVELKALPKYADEVDMYVEVSPVRTYSQTALYAVDAVSAVARANVHVTSHVGVDAAKVPVDKLVPVELYSDASVEVFPYRVLRGGGLSSYVIQARGANLTAQTYTSTHVYPYFTFSSSMPSDWLIDIYAQSIRSASDEVYAATHAAVNLVLETQSSYAVDLPYMPIGRYTADALTLFAPPNVSITTHTAHSTLVRVIASAVYRSVWPAIEIRLSPIVSTAHQALAALWTPQNIAMDTYAASSTYPYRTLRSRYAADVYAWIAMIAPEMIRATAGDSVAFFRFVDNVFHYTHTGYAFLRYVGARSAYVQLPALLFARDAVYAYTSDASESYVFGTSITAYTQQAVDVEYVHAYPVDVRLTSPVVVVLRSVAPNVPIATSTAYALVLAGKVHAYTNTAVDASYSYAYSREVRASTSTSVAFALARVATLTSNAPTVLSLADKIVHVAYVAVRPVYMPEVLRSETQSAYDVQLMQGNVIQDEYAAYAIRLFAVNTTQSDRSAYSVYVYRDNVAQSDQSRYSVQIERYPALSTYLVTYCLSVSRPNAVQLDSSRNALTIYRPGEQADRSRYRLAVYQGNVLHSVRSRYVLTLYAVKTLGFSASVAGSHDAGLYKYRYLTMYAEASASHATSLERPEVELRGTAEVEYGAYSL